MRQRFRLMAVSQVVGIIATTGLLYLTLDRLDYVAVPALIVLVIAVQVAVLLHTVQAHVNALEDFFATVSYEDFTRRFIEDDIDVELRDAFNRVIERFQEARAERDIQAGYLDTVIKHVPVPFLAARQDGSLSLVNNPARRLTGLPAFSHLDDLAALDQSLPARLVAIPAGRQELIQAEMRGLPVELRVSVAEIRLEGETERLYSIENLSGELSARESSAWRNLIRVLTHEIMNTLTPVTSLAETTAGLLDDPTAKDDIREAVQTIGRRSSGLMSFVSRYRELLKVPVPSPEQISVGELFRNVTVLLGEQLEGVNIEIDIDPASLDIDADPQLMDQVMVNLVKNAVEALEGIESPAIRLAARLEPGRTVLSVTDNGPGMPEDVRDQVFIPFFTTKRDGSGIGLSLSRQILTAHGGDLVLQTGDDGTTISLVFG